MGVGLWVEVRRIERLSRCLLGSLVASFTRDIEHE